MKILITGSNGFIAKNLRAALQRDERNRIYLFSRDDSLDLLEAYLKEAEFIYHLAGVNRTEELDDFYSVNRDLTQYIIKVLERNNKKTPVVFSSSVQATLDNDYGKSKLSAEKIIADYAAHNGVNCHIYRLPNVFGKWSRPHYNSVIATWCHNISRGIDIEIHNENTRLTLAYVDDVICDFIHCMTERSGGFKEIGIQYTKSLGEIKTLLYQFKTSRKTLIVPDVGGGFKRALYATYLSFLDETDFSYTLDGHSDSRGTFYEILRTENSGQFSLSTTKPGITRGDHYHDTKNEKFLVIQGRAVIEQRDIFSDKTIVYEVSDQKMEIVEMIPGYTHNITNTGDSDLLLLIWSNEQFDQRFPDTYISKVRR